MPLEIFFLYRVTPADTQRRKKTSGRERAATRKRERESARARERERENARERESERERACYRPSHSEASSRLSNIATSKLLAVARFVNQEPPQSNGLWRQH